MYKKLIGVLREYAEWAHANEWECPIALQDYLEEAADTIEKLQAELEQVKKERDAAVDDLKSVCDDSGDGCGICKHVPCAEKYGRCIGWQWRGLRERGGLN